MRCRTAVSTTSGRRMTELVGCLGSMSASQQSRPQRLRRPRAPLRQRNAIQAYGTRHEHDGDTHGWLKVDSGFENLLNSGNMNDEDGNLVFEIICRFPIT